MAYQKGKLTGGAKALEFFDNDEEDKVGLTVDGQPIAKISIAGPSGSGKTRFACTGQPWVGAVLADSNGPPTVREMRKAGYKIITPNIDLRVPLNNPLRLVKAMREAEDAVAAGEKDPTKAIHAAHLQRILEVEGALLDMDRVKTLFIDGAHVISKSASFAEHGRVEKIMQRDRGEQNRLMCDVIQAAELAGRHLIVTSDAKSRYVEKPDGKGNMKSTETKFLKRDGWGALTGYVRIECLLIHCWSSEWVDRAQFILDDHLEGYEEQANIFWKRVKRKDQDLRLNDWLMLIQQSKDNSIIMGDERDNSVFLNREVTFPNLYKRVFEMDLEGADDDDE